MTVQHSECTCTCPNPAAVENFEVRLVSNSDQNMTDLLIYCLLLISLSSVVFVYVTV